MQLPHAHTAIVIVGPTASGKTSLAVDIAKQLETSVISADSRQCFRELNIGVAKPTLAELKGVPHYFINSHSIHDIVNVKVFEEYALNAAYEVFKTSEFVVVAGGTGLYIKAFCDGIDEMPEVDNDIRVEINKQYRQNGIEWLTNTIKIEDGFFWKQNAVANPQRLMRALEVMRSTGRSITSFQQNKLQPRRFNIIKIGIDIPKPKLHYNINTRVDVMMKHGLLNEAKALYPFKSINALQTVGYQELFDYLDNKMELQVAVELIKTHTRQYAKRQLTWFRKDESIHWIDSHDMTAKDVASRFW